MKSLTIRFTKKSAKNPRFIHKWLTTWDNLVLLYPPNKKVEVLVEPAKDKNEVIAIYSKYLGTENKEIYEVAISECSDTHAIIKKTSLHGVYKCWDDIRVTWDGNESTIEASLFSEIPKGFMSAISFILVPYTHWYIKRRWTKIIKSWEHAD